MTDLFALTNQLPQSTRQALPFLPTTTAGQLDKEIWAECMAALLHIIKAQALLDVQHEPLIRQLGEIEASCYNLMFPAKE